MTIKVVTVTAFLQNGMKLNDFAMKMGLELQLKQLIYVRVIDEVQTQSFCEKGNQLHRTKV